jgi:sec-independent protein translocase protein TatC
MNETKNLGILGHLRELRKRLLWSLIAIAIGTGVALWQADWIIGILQNPAGDTVFIYNKMTEGFSVSMRVSFAAGIVLAMPVIMYHILMFVMPALTSREKKAVLIILPWVVLMFFAGVYFGYRFLIPPALNFLLNWGTESATYLLTLGDYINFVTRLILLIGLVFEMPVLVTFLARIGVVSSKWLMGKQKWVFILAFVVAAVITPTPDAINQTIVAATLIVLFEVSIGLAWLVEKRKKKSQEVINSDD